MILNHALSASARAELLATILLKKVDIGDRIKQVCSLGLIEDQNVDVLQKVRLARAYLENCFSSLAFGQVNIIKDFLRVTDINPTWRTLLAQTLAFHGFSLQSHRPALQELLSHPQMSLNNKAMIASLMLCQHIPIRDDVQLENFIGNVEVDLEEQVRLGLFMLRQNLPIHTNNLQTLKGLVFAQLIAPKMRAALASLLISHGMNLADRVGDLLEFISDSNVAHLVRADLTSYVINVNPGLAVTYAATLVNVLTSSRLSLSNKAILATKMLNCGGGIFLGMNSHF